MHFSARLPIYNPAVFQSKESSPHGDPDSSGASTAQASSPRLSLPGQPSQKTSQVFRGVRPTLLQDLVPVKSRTRNVNKVAGSCMPLSNSTTYVGTGYKEEVQRLSSFASGTYQCSIIIPIAATLFKVTQEDNPFVYAALYSDIPRARLLPDEDLDINLEGPAYKGSKYHRW